MCLLTTPMACKSLSSMYDTRIELLFTVHTESTSSCIAKYRAITVQVLVALYSIPVLVEDCYLYCLQSPTNPQNV